MKNHAPGKSHRTPIKHFVLNLALGQIVGVLSNRNPIVPARLPLHVVDLCAGDGVSEPGLTSSPELIRKHINFPGLNGEAYATLFETADNTFTLLKEGFAGDNKLELIHGDARDFKLRAKPGQAVFIHADPNSLKDWPVTPELAGSLTASTTFLATLGCNVGGLKRLGFDEHRRQWYEHIRHLLVVPPWHDVQLYVLNRDKAQWAYLLRVPSAWATNTARTVCAYGTLHWPNGLRFASCRDDPDNFAALIDELFLTRKERENGVR